LIQPYIGKSEKNDVDYLGAQGDLDSEEMYGLSLTYQMDDGKVFFAYSAGDGSWQPHEGSQQTKDVITTTDNPYKFYDLGVQYGWGNWSLLAEYNLIDSQSSNNVYGVQSQIPEHDAWYVTIGHRYGKFTPHVTLLNRSSLNESGQAFGLSGDHDGYVLGLRYELIPGKAALKFDYEYAETSGGWTGGYSGPSVSADPIKDRESEIFTVAVDLVF
jgi:predicted porin